MNGGGEDIKIIIKIQVYWHASNRLQNSMHCMLSPHFCLKEDGTRWLGWQETHFFCLRVFSNFSTLHILFLWVILFLKLAPNCSRPAFSESDSSRQAKGWLFFSRSTQRHHPSLLLTLWMSESHPFPLRVLNWFFFPSQFWKWKNGASEPSYSLLPSKNRMIPNAPQPCRIVWTVTLMQTATYSESPVMQQV